MITAIPVEFIWLTVIVAMTMAGIVAAQAE
jgi:hypothetical protein